MPSSPRTHATAECIPPRWRVFRRFGLGLGAWLLFLVLVRLAWGWEANRRLQARIDAYRAAGEPILLEDLEPEPIPDDENAAVLYEEAYQLLGNVPSITKKTADGDTISLVFTELYSGGIYPADDWLTDYPEECRQLYDAAIPLLRRVRTASGCPRCAWNLPLSSPLLLTRSASLSPHRTLMKSLCSAAVYGFARGDHASAVQRLQDALLAADRLYDARRFLIGYLVASAGEQLAVTTLGEHLDTVRVAGNARSDTVHTPAAAEQIEALVKQLLDESLVKEGWRDAYFGERVHTLDTIHTVCQGLYTIQPPSLGRATVVPAWWETPIRVLLSPMWRIDGAQYLEHETGVMRSGLADCWSEAEALLPQDYHANTGLGALIHYPDMLEWNFFGSSAPTSVHEFRRAARRRMAAIALAVRWYELNHGARPAALGELVPEYLPALSRDPFRCDGETFQYLPQNPNPRLYSVGPNGRDDGGYHVRHPRVRAGGGGVTNWDETDLVFPLDGSDVPERIAGEPHEIKLPF